MKKIMKIILIIFLLSPMVVNANIICNDGSISDSCLDCHRGCCSHHGGCSGKSTSSNKKKTKNIIKPKVVLSSDASLGSIKINGSKVEIKNNKIEYNTRNDNITIDVKTNHKGAKASYKKNVKVSNGTYKSTITVVAQDNKTTKKYDLIINRLSDNTNIKVFVNDKEVKFINYIGTIKLDYFTNEIEIDYELSDENANVILEYDKEFDEEYKEIELTVEAESGKKQLYLIKIQKESKKEFYINIFNILKKYYNIFVNKLRW